MDYYDDNRRPNNYDSKNKHYKGLKKNELHEYVLATVAGLFIGLILLIIIF